MHLLTWIRQLAWRSVHGWWGLAANLVGIVVIIWVVQPVFTHAFVSCPSPSPQTTSDLRTNPDSSTLLEIAAQAALGLEAPPGPSAVALADRWLSAASMPGSVPHPVLTTVTAEDLTRDLGVGSLSIASLYAADVFVGAFRSSGDSHYLFTARDIILGFARFERTAWVDRGYLWNDHAIAARVGVIIRFWAVYRSHPSFDVDSAREILQHAARSTLLLAKPSHFAAWSNHGVMQNVALLQLAAAFPSLVDSTAIGRLAMYRLRMQWPHYISSEGVILEHSAGYHKMGLQLLGTAARAAELNGFEVPESWRERLRLAELFRDRLTRPDGTLPPFGDTQVEVPRVPPSSLVVLGSETVGEMSLYPLSGYAIWTAHDESGRATSHCTVAWSNFPGHAHKLGDDLSMVIWARGRGWVTPSGYAPYGSEHRKYIEGWLGSNAPHGLGESAKADRRTELIGSLKAPSTVLLDMRRVGASSGGFRRQVVQIGGARWLVLDHPLESLPSQDTETIWTFLPDLTVDQLGVNRFAVRDVHGNTMAVTVLNSSEAQGLTKVHRGSHEPFVGWVATERGMENAPALRVVTTSASWTATLLDLTQGMGSLDLQFVDAERWRASGIGWRVSRNGSRFDAHVDGRQDASHISSPAPVQGARAAIDAALTASIDAYPRYRNLDAYRLRAAIVLAAALFAQMLLSRVVRTTLEQRGWLVHAYVLILVAWAALAIWLGVVYFAR